MKAALRIIICLIFGSILMSQTTFGITLSGLVVDKDGYPLASTSVKIKNSTTGTGTNQDGKFSLEVSKLPVTLVFEFLGFETQELIISKVEEASNIKVVLLESSAILGTTVVKVDRISEKQKEEPLTVESMGIKSIKEAPAASFYESLGNLKGVDITAASLGFRVVNTRGFNSTSPVRSLQLIDGVDNQSPGLNFALGNFLGANDLDIRNVEIIAGASGAFYGPNAFNGVINMETKNPFDYPGISVETKLGERSLGQLALRWADVVKGKDSAAQFAYKVGFLLMSAQDWQADNYNPTIDSKYGINNPGGYDAVNIYGDESFATNNDYTSSFSKYDNPGLGYFYRTGYKEVDLVDYKTENLKFNSSLHYKLKDTSHISYAFNFGGGSTVYQGDNRYRLRDIKFWQHRLEWKKENDIFIRLYSTQEDAGNTYDIVSTAFRLNEMSKANDTWNAVYSSNWKLYGYKKQVERLPDYPKYVASVHGTLENWANNYLDPFLAQYQDSLIKWHAQNRIFVDLADGAGATSRFIEGTPAFDSAFNVVTTSLFTQNGTRFFDKSALYHTQIEKKLKLKDFDGVTIGFSGRLYRPNSQGTILNDTGDVVITNHELGLYGGVSKKYYQNKVKVNLTARIDKNQNFNFLASPAASVIYLPNKKNTYRVSFSSAIRNPTLADQYLYYDVGRAKLIGNLSGYDSLITISSFINYRNTLNLEEIVYYEVSPIRPEKAKTVEFGYKGSLLKNSVFVDFGYYFSLYTDFIGYNIGLDARFDKSTGFPMGGIEVYRVAANATSLVTTQGASFGINYYFKNYALSGNYSWNVLNKKGTDDPIIPAFNTPKNKFNLSFSGRNLKLTNSLKPKFGFAINYKWIQGYVFEGSPQFTGSVPTYDMVDAQMNYLIEKSHLTIKLGASNVLGIVPLFDSRSDSKRRTVFNNLNYQVYGGPYVGRLAYISLLFDIDHRHK
ncbi:MAG: carboxypeptidase-like regulatory domain-containing protein [Flavobacteriales bacterium]|nr:carboxypeptidase-like regulatory domain-containing protein [Flavobacteriales bacterium]